MSENAGMWVIDSVAVAAEMKIRQPAGPVIYSNQSMTVTANENSKFSLLIDIYGAVFSLFRGYDELIHCEKSSHDRHLLEACYALTDWN